MHMTGSHGLFTIPPEHLPGLIALVVFPLVCWATINGCRAMAARGHVWAVGLMRRYDRLPAAGHLALFGLGVGAVVHAAIVPTHWADSRVTALLFIVDSAGLLAAAVWTVLGGRGWRIVSSAMLSGTAAGYVLYLVEHWETADIVGVLTSAIELGVALVLLAPESADRRAPTGGLRWAGALALALFALLGAVAVADSGQASAGSVAGRGSAGSSLPRASGSSGTSTTGSASPSGPMGMSMGSPATTALSLPTKSAAGAISWPQPSGTMPAGMEMVPSSCTSTPTTAQSNAAVALVDATAAAAAPYRSLAAAQTAGYVPVTPTGARIVHYVNPSILRGSAPLDPNAIPSLVYVNTRHGAVLLAAMYLMTPCSSAAPPQPGGCLTIWHEHSDLCFSGGSVAGNSAASGTCPTGTVNKLTEPMLHVWMTPVPGGPLAVDPGGRSEVVGAAQSPAPSPVNGTA